jgi:hypothetical protein
MPEEKGVMEIYKWKLIASRPVGWWMETVMEGIQAMGTVNCKR